MGDNRFFDKLKPVKSDSSIEALPGLSKETNKKLNGFKILGSQGQEQVQGKVLEPQTGSEKSGALAKTSVDYVKTGDTMPSELPPTGVIYTLAAKLAKTVGITPSNLPWQPFKNQEIDTVNCVSEQAWQDAIKMFPELTKAGLSPDRIKIVSQAILSNELYSYNVGDRIDDACVKKIGYPVSELITHTNAKDTTLGYSQISENGVIKDRKEFPRFKKFLDQNGYKLGDESKVLLNLNLAPALIAANLAHNAKMYERHNILVSELNLIYGYNPDVYFAKSDTKHKHPIPKDEAEKMPNYPKNFTIALLPTNPVLAKSKHTSAVCYWLDKMSKIQK